MSSKSANQAPDATIETGLLDLENKAAATAPPAGTAAPEQPVQQADTAAGAESPAGTAAPETPVQGADTAAGAEPPRVPPPPMLDPARPWQSIVEGGFKTVAKNLPNVEWPEDGQGLMIWGFEAQLTKMMPNGIVDIEKYPALAILIGAVMIGMHNMDLVEEEDGTVHYSFWRFRPVARKVIRKTPGAQLQVNGEGAVATKS